jgi:tetratricopeptide (TPR) repeat protein
VRSRDAGGEDVKGELAEGVVPGLLRDMYVGRRSGTLHFAKGSEEQSIRIHRGHIVNARTNVKEERLGEILVRHGRLTPDGLERATEVVIREKRRLGEVLVELGLLDPAGLEDAIALRVREILAKVFTWDEGTFQLEEDEEEPPGELTLRLSTGELILDAVRAIRDPDVVRYALGDMDRVLALSSDPLLRFQQLPLSPNDGFVLSRVDGRLSAREVETMTPLPPEDVRRSLLALLSTGILEYLTRAERSAVDGGDIPRERVEADPAPPPRPDTRPVDPPTEVGGESSGPSPPDASAGDDGDGTAPVPTSAAATEGEDATASEAAPISLPPDTFDWTGTAAATREREAAKRGPGQDEAATGRRREIEEAWEGLESKNHFQVLGLTRQATAADVKGAYFRLARRFHPDVHHEASMEDMRDKLEAVFIRLGEAYEVLRDTAKRRDYEERLGRPRPPSSGPAPAGTDTPDPEADVQARAERAEEAVRRAEELYKSASEAAEGARVRQKYWEAIQLVEPIVEKLSGRIRLRGRLVLARCYLENPNWAKRAEEALQVATREEPADPDAYRLLGKLYEERGLRTRATTMFRRVQELKPDDAEAAEALLRIGTGNESPPSEEGGGFLKRIFRRS